MQENKLPSHIEKSLEEIPFLLNQISLSQDLLPNALQFLKQFVLVYQANDQKAK